MSLEGILCETCLSGSGLSIAQVREAINGKPERCLLVLDGLDEYHWNIACVNAMVLDGDHRMHLLLTSRPTTDQLEAIRGRATQHFELAGLRSHHMRAFATAYFKQTLGPRHASAIEGRVSSLTEVIDNDPDLRTMCQIPINLALVCAVAIENPESLSTGTGVSLTNIYSVISMLVCKTAIETAAAGNGNDDNNNNALADAGLSQREQGGQKTARGKPLTVAETLSRLGKLAHSSLSEGYQLMLPKELVAKVMGGTDHARFGMLIKESIVLGGQTPAAAALPKDMFMFLHFTFQEFFVARHLVAAKKLLFPTVAKVAKDPKWHMTLRFTVGLLGELHGKKGQADQARAISMIAEQGRGERLHYNTTVTTIDARLLALCLQCVHDAVDATEALVTGPLAQAVRPLLLGDVNLAECHVGDAEACALGKVLPLINHMEPATESIRLDRNHIRMDGAITLGNGLKLNHTITELTLAYNDIGDQGAAALAQALRQNTTLASLDLEHCGVGHAGSSALGDALVANHALVDLNLAGNEARGRGVAALVAGLRVNKTLRSLDMADNGLGGESADLFADLLEEGGGSVTLAKLNLWGNPLGLKGHLLLLYPPDHVLCTVRISGRGKYVDLNAIMAGDDSVDELDLAASKLEDSDALFLATELRGVSLERLDVSNNAFTPSGVMHFAKLLKANKGIGTFVLRHEEVIVDQASRKALEQAWSPRQADLLDVGLDAKLTKADRIAVHDSRHSWSGEAGHAPAANDKAMSKAQKKTTATRDSSRSKPKPKRGSASSSGGGYGGGGDPFAQPRARSSGGGSAKGTFEDQRVSQIYDDEVF